MNLPRIIVRNAPANGTATKNGISGFIIYPLNLFISLMSKVPYFLYILMITAISIAVVASPITIAVSTSA